MGMFKELDIMGEELQMHLGANRISKNPDTQAWEYNYGTHTAVPAHSCEAAILFLLNSTFDGIRDGSAGVSRVDKNWLMTLGDTIKKYGRLWQSQLDTIQKRQEYHGKNGLLLKYRGQLERAGFYVPVLLRQFVPDRKIRVRPQNESL